MINRLSCLAFVTVSSGGALFRTEPLQFPEREFVGVGDGNLFNVNEHFAEDFALTPSSAGRIGFTPSPVYNERMCSYSPVSEVGMSRKRWQVEVDFMGVPMEALLDTRKVATTVPYWFWASSFQKMSMKKIYRGFLLDDCRGWESFPSFVLSIGGREIVVQPSDYVYFNKVRGCMVDIEPTRREGVVTIGPAVLRSQSIHFNYNQVGTCARRH